MDPKWRYFGAMGALQRAAADAWAEVESLRQEWASELTIAGTCRAAHIQVLDTSEAYDRALARAKSAQHLADDDAGGYNAFEEQA